jgi:hypothetical protein
MVQEMVWGGKTMKKQHVYQSSGFHDVTGRFVKIKDERRIYEKSVLNAFQPVSGLIYSPPHPETGIITNACDQAEECPDFALGNNHCIKHGGKGCKKHHLTP